MSSDAKHVIADILLVTEERLIGANPSTFHIISSMLWAYYREWGWVLDA